MIVRVVIFIKMSQKHLENCFLIEFSVNTTASQDANKSEKMALGTTLKVSHTHTQPNAMMSMYACISRCYLIPHRIHSRRPV